MRRHDPGYLARLRDNAIERLHVYSEAYGWAPRAGAEAVERGAPTRINPGGQRGRLIAPARTARPRVLLLGDSTAFGFGVGDEATYAALLDATPGAPEVVNLGVEGFGPDQSLLRYEREGVAYAPDVLIFSLCVDNDFADARLPVFLYDGRHPKPYFTVRDGQLVLHDAHLRLGLVTRLGVRLAERSHLYNRLARARSAATVPPDESWRARRARALLDPEAAIDLVARLLLRLRDDLAPRRARLLVLLHPSKETLHHGSSLVDGLRSRLGAGGVVCLDLAAYYRARGLRFSDVAFDPTGHLNAAGHARVTELLRTCLVPRQVAPDGVVCPPGASYDLRSGTATP